MSQKQNTSAVTRRDFAAIVAGAGVAAPALLGQQTPPPQAGPFDAPLEFTRKDVPAKAHAFPMAQVRLLPGSVFHDAQEWNRGYMSRLAADRLLYNFRANAGLPVGASGGFAGGGNDNWERPADGTHATELRGHFTGHFLSASANLWASTGDRDAKAKGDEMVAELAKCQQKLGGGYLSAFPVSFWERLDRLSGAARQPGSQESIPWAPFYTLHKIMAGLFDMYQHAGNRQALEVVSGMADWADRWSAAKTEEHMQQILNTEFGGMAETLYNLAAATDNDRWARTGDRYTKKRFVNPLALRRDQLTGLHVNTHVPQVIAAARRYEISGDARFHDAADFFYWTVTTGRTYVTGGTSNGESWRTPPGQLAAELKTSVDTAECCCSYNMLKLARHLYRWHPDAGYFDYFERTLLNQRIGTIRPKTGWTQYYLSLTPGAWKTFCSEDHSFWGCTGTGVEEYSKLNDSIYWHDDRGLFVNLFIPSELDWPERGLKVRQENKFPEEQGTTLRIATGKPQPLDLRLRVPAWAAGSTVKINGKPLEAAAEPGSYLTIHRTWKNGDRVEMSLPMRLTVEAMPDDATLQAFLYGPLVLAGDLGNERITDDLIFGISGPALYRPRTNPQPQTGPVGLQVTRTVQMDQGDAILEPVAPATPVPAPAPARPQRPTAPPLDIPTFQAAGDDPSGWIKPGGKALTFRTTGQKKDVTLTPLNALFDKRYSVYWKVS